MTPALREKGLHLLPQLTTGTMRNPLFAASPLLLALGACTLSPVSSKIDPGRTPFLVFVAEGADDNTDLFIGEPGGGRILQLTFTPVLELAPALSPDGSVVAFLRMKDTLPGTRRDIVLMGITSGSETRLSLPPEAGVPLRLAWSEDLEWIYAFTAQGIWRLSAQRGEKVAELLTGAAREVADSALSSWIGRPRFAEIITCANPGVCLTLPSGDTIQLTSTGRDAFPWGADSVAWFEGTRVLVRALSGGNLRQVDWTGMPSHPRSASYSWMITPRYESAYGGPGRLEPVQVDSPLYRR